MSFIDDGKEIDAKLRYRILQVLDGAKASSAGVRGTKLRSWVADLDLDFADDHHCLDMIQYLFSAGYIEIHDQRVHAHERLALGKIDCKITAKGMRFLAGEEAVDGMIADGRIKRKV